MKKTEVQQAYYEVLESEAAVVRKVFSLYTVEGYSIRSIVQRLNAEKIATRSKKAAWRHATVWGMLKNPAYRGWACFGKTAPGPPPRLNRTSRQQGRCVSRNRAKRALNWLRSGWSSIKSSPLGVRKNRAFYRDCWFVLNVVMPLAGLIPELPTDAFIITGVRARMPDDLRGECVRLVRGGWTAWIS